MARAPPPKRMSVDASFHDCEPSIKFDGTNFEDFQFATLAALSAYPAAAAIEIIWSWDIFQHPRVRSQT